MSISNIFTIVVVAVVTMIWLVLLTAIFQTYSSGELLLKRPEKRTKTYLILGVGLFIFSIMNIYTLKDYSLSMKIVNWLAFPTVALEYLFFAFSRIQFREKALVCNNFVTKYIDIKSYKWETPDRLVITREKGYVKVIRINVLPQHRQEIDRKLSEMITQPVSQ